MNHHRYYHLYAAASVLAIAASAVWAVPAVAQDSNPAAPPIEEVTVTGTSIRGTAPVGSAITSVTQEDIKATGATTVEGILANVPQLMGMGQVDGGTTGQGAQQAIIHQLGQSASTSTLTLIDGHRVPTSGTNHSFVDPNMLPLNMVERVEVLADGVSAVYGSDAVAGVVNFITRKRYDGVQITGNAGFANGKQDVNLGFLTGSVWDKGSVVFAYSYTRQGALADTARPWTYPDHRDQPGGLNRSSFNCDPATLIPAGQSLVYTSATSGSAVANASANFMCSDWKYADLIPKTIRNNAMAKIEQDFGDNWTLDSDLLYASRAVSARRSRGTLTATAFDTGAQANPFYVTPAGYTGTATSEQIRWDSNALLGPGAYNVSGGDTVYGDVNLEYRIGGDWAVDLLTMVGRDDSSYGFVNTLNASVATLALNGTPNTGGNTTQVVPNTNIIYNQFPLTTATALDVWDPAGSNRTSAQVIKDLTNDALNSHLVSGITQARLQAQGTLIDLPAGPVKVAIGGEANRTSLFEYLAQGQGAGPTSNSAVYRTWHFSRSIQSAYAEANIPIVSAAQGIPLMQALTLDLSGRFDHYSDFGNTANPKIAFDWRVYDDLKLRANWSTSFVAPPEDEIGGDGTWNNTNYAATTQSASIPVALFPNVTQLGIPGCTAASASCSLGTLMGIEAINSNPHQGPSHGRGWGVGFDYTPSFLDGFKGSFTFWDASFRGGSQGAPFVSVYTSKALSHLLTLYPNCATPAQIKAITGNLPLVGAVPPCTTYIYVQQNDGLLNLAAQGIDADFNYVMPTDSWGTFSVGDAVSLFTSYLQSAGPDGIPYSVLDKSGAHGSIGLQMRGSAGWAYKSFGAQFFINYTGPYTNWNSPDNPIKLDPVTLNPAGGGDRVSSNTTFDLNLTYEFNDGYVGNNELSLNIRNLFDTRPPYDASTSGYNAGIASPVGRLITVGFTSRL
ncbi:MAG TPA: TonB-dependent receptor [Rhizomicrobium sp.]|jgi:iron complex outermembrane receptor protein|nr:TonB-dependent receptor [Rhizomicrobium sp.]